MSRIFSSKKRFVLGVVAALAITTAAFAYWTTSGEDTGSATAGTDVGVTLSGDAADDIYPGGNFPVTVNIANDSPDQSQRVKYLHVDVDPAATGCDASWFTFKLTEDTAGTAANPYSYLLDDEIAAGDATNPYPGTLSMSNPNVDQDLCKLSEIDLNYSVSNSSTP
jgi:hypothetical protein